MEPKNRVPVIGLAGGSGSGKTWLQRRFHELIGDSLLCLSVDDFYRDRSHLSPKQRTRVNYDSPTAIDWSAFESVLESVR